MEPHGLDLGEARRIGNAAQRLTADGPLDFVGSCTTSPCAGRPVAAIAPLADLVMWSRLGDAYRPEHLTSALEVDRMLLELSAMIRPMSDLPLYRGMFPPWASTDTVQRWFTAIEGFARDIRALLERSGPLPSKEIPDTSAVAWSSSGWTTERHVTQMLELLAMRGDVAITGRRGRERVWDVPERVYPPAWRRSILRTRGAAATSAGSALWASPDRSRPGRRSSPTTSATPASPRSSRA